MVLSTTLDKPQFDFAPHSLQPVAVSDSLRVSGCQTGSEKETAIYGLYTKYWLSRVILNFCVCDCKFKQLIRLDTLAQLVTETVNRIP